jgi:hypothetical protein
VFGSQVLGEVLARVSLGRVVDPALQLSIEHTVRFGRCEVEDQVPESQHAAGS